MAEEEEHKSGMTHWQFLFGFFAVLGLLIYLWYQNGGPERADLRGIFLAPPPPIGSGGAYGPNGSGPSEVSPNAVEQNN